MTYKISFENCLLKILSVYFSLIYIRILPKFTVFYNEIHTFQVIASYFLRFID